MLESQMVALRQEHAKHNRNSNFDSQARRRSVSGFIFVCFCASLAFLFTARGPLLSFLAILGPAHDRHGRFLQMPVV